MQAFPERELTKHNKLIYLLIEDKPALAFDEAPLCVVLKPNSYFYMAQLSEKPITGKDIMEYVSARDDFALEMQTFEACIERGMIATHGGAYTDPVTGKTRQYDIRARLAKWRREVFMAIECKCLKNFHPLVVSCVPRTNEENYHEMVVTRDIPDGVHNNALVMRIHGKYNLMYRKNEMVGKSMAQVGKKDNGELAGTDSEVYEKWSQAIASAYDLVSDAFWSRREVKAPLMSVVLPILVVPDNILWVAEYSQNGNPLGDPRLSKECTVYLGKTINGNGPMFTYTFSHLHIFTFSAFTEFLDKLATNDGFIDDFLPAELVRG